MVDVSLKPAAARQAVAEAMLRLKPSTLRLIKKRALKKGDALTVAKLASILAAKRTDEFIPLAHNIGISSCETDFSILKKGIRVVVKVRTINATGCEMEALLAASVASLALYDMVKAVDRGAVIENVRLLEKKGGRSGHWIRR